MLVISLLLVVLFLATCIAEQKGQILVQNNMDLLHSHLADRTGILFHVNQSAFSLANALRLTKIGSFSEVDKKVIIMFALPKFLMFS
jgi:hypothetical protein